MEPQTRRPAGKCSLRSATVKDLKEMLYMKERGEDPADLIMDAVERFYVEYE